MSDEAQVKATPRPWEYREGDDNGFYPVGSESVIGIYSPANYELIVRAVNSHDKLLEALKGLNGFFREGSKFYISKLGGGITNGDQEIIDKLFMAAEAAIQSVEEKQNAG